MYRFLDREIESLSEGERLILRALRDWSVARHLDRCPVDAVTLRFLSHRLIGGLEPFHAILELLARHGRQRIEIGCPCHRQVTEGEAMLLALFFPGCSASTMHDRRIAALVPSRQVGPFAGHLTELRAAMLVSGMA